MIRTILTYAFVCLLGLFIQGALIKSLFPSASAPDFLLVIVVVLALRHPQVAGLIGAFCVGLAGDFAAARFIGPNAAGSVVAFVLVMFFSTKVYAERGIALGMLTFFASIAKSVTQLLMLNLYVSVDLLTSEGIKIVFIEAVLSALVAPFVFLVLERRSRLANA